MKTIETSSDLKTCLSEIKEHIARNPETKKGNVRAKLLLNISREVYDVRSSNLSYNDKVESQYAV